MHAFLCVHGRPLINGERIREFIHRPQVEKGCYVWRNRELTIEEHGEVARKVVEENTDLRPYTRLVADVAAKDPRDVRIVELETLVKSNRQEISNLRQALSPRPARE